MSCALGVWLQGLNDLSVGVLDREISKLDEMACEKMDFDQNGPTFLNQAT